MISLASGRPRWRDGSVFGVDQTAEAQAAVGIEHRLRSGGRTSGVVRWGGRGAGRSRCLGLWGATHCVSVSVIERRCLRGENQFRVRTTDICISPESGNYNECSDRFECCRSRRDWVIGVRRRLSAKQPIFSRSPPRTVCVAVGPSPGGRTPRWSGLRWLRGALGAPDPPVLRVPPRTSPSI